MAKLIIERGNDRGREFTLTQSQTIGRLKRNDIAIEDDGTSRQHARITKRENHYFILDLNSSNGVHVNGKKIHKARLEHGDRVTIGHAIFRFEGRDAPADAPPKKAAARKRGAISADTDISYGGPGGASMRLVTARSKQGQQPKRQDHLWLRGDFSQLGGAYKALLVLGLCALVVGLGYLGYVLTAG